MTDEKIQRINELYKKSKTVGLTDAEKKEQNLLILSSEICVDS